MSREREKKEKVENTEREREVRLQTFRERYTERGKTANTQRERKK